MASDEPAPRLPKMKAVMRPDNPFRDPYNVGLFGGVVAGIIGGYFFAGQFLPAIRKVMHIAHNGRCKMALVVRDDLRMSKGKIASQCSHATLTMHKNLMSPLTRYGNGRGLLAAWEIGGEPTIVLRVNDMAGAQEIMTKAKESKVPVFTVYDAGRTEVPAGSLTVFSIGPANIDTIDRITGHLRTL